MNAGHSGPRVQARQPSTQVSGLRQAGVRGSEVAWNVLELLSFPPWRTGRCQVPVGLPVVLGALVACPGLANLPQWERP